MKKVYKWLLALPHPGAAIGTSGISIPAKAALDRMGTTTPVCQKMLEQVKPNRTKHPSFY